jgi:hypothetical protein
MQTIKVIDIFVHKNVRLSELIVSDILDSYHLSIVFHLLDHIRTRNLSEPVDKFTDCVRLQSLASELISPRIQMNSEEEGDNAAVDYTASIASAYRLSTRKITLSELDKDIPDLENLLKHKQRLRSLWQVNRNRACKMALNWVAKTSRRMTRRKALDRWQTSVENCKVTPQVLWPIAKSLMKTDGPKAPTAVHGPLGVTYHRKEKANVISDCLENHFISHDLFDENHKRQVNSTVQAQLASVEGTPLGKVRPRNIHNFAN